LQDPLAELVKVDPKSIGVGQYQHDVDQRQLQQSLDSVVESCVNRVGVDLNTASWALLRYVAGISERTAQKIVEYRNENGRFKSRVQLNAVAGIGPKTFEQAAGFLRIRGGENPLDSTAVHPESYEAVERMAARAGVPVGELVGRKDLIDKLEKDGMQTASVGVYTFKDIVEELRKPGRDPRDQFCRAQLPRRREGYWQRASRDEARGRGDQRDQVRRVRRCGRAPGWAGSYQRTVEPLHHGAGRSGEKSGRSSRCRCWR
jgi:uncharacterized protein